MQWIQQRVMVQVFHRNAVATVVAVVDDVQRLVHIADKMDEIPERLGAFYQINRLVFQNRSLRFDGARYASVCSAVFIE